MRSTSGGIFCKFFFAWTISCIPARTDGGGAAQGDVVAHGFTSCLSAAISSIAPSSNRL